MKKRLNWLSALALALCGVGIGMVITYTALTARMNAYLASTQNVYTQATGKLSQILAYLDYYFVEDVELDRLTDTAAAGMVAGTGDRWSYYVSAEDMAQYTEQVTNSYMGVGITISGADATDDGFPVTQVTPGGPADIAGLQVGDVLNAVDGQSAILLGMEETKARVRGAEGTDVTLTLLRDGAPYDVTITRGSVNVAVAEGTLLDGGIGLVTIANFDANAADETIACIEELMQQGATSLLFDVRNNPGGLRAELVRILDYLLPEGLLFQSTNYKGDTSQDLSDPACLEVPMAVLVNANSYSAAEFFAACLQEYGAAAVIGEQTCGKGYYQQSFVLADGSAINISTGAYFTPAGKSLIGEGIAPDVAVSMDMEQTAMLYAGLLDAEDDAQLQAALEYLTDQPAN